MNSLRLDLSILDKEEINPIDFACIEAIRVFAPEVYLAMTNEARVFTSVGVPRYGPIEGPEDVPDEKEKLEWKKHRQTRIDEIVKKAPKERRDSIKAIIFSLFPQLRDGPPMVAEYANWRKERRVCSMEMFDKYFLLLVPEKFASVKEIKGLLSVVDDFPDFLEKLEKFHKQRKLAFVFRRIPDHLDELSEQQREDLLANTFYFVAIARNFATKLWDEHQLQRQAIEVGCQTLESIGKEKRAEFSSNVMSKIGIFSIINRFFEFLITARFKEQKMGKTVLTPILEKNELEIPCRAYVAKIKKAAENGTLTSDPGWTEALLFWRKYGEQKDVDAYVTELLGTDEGLITLLREFAKPGIRGFDNDRKLTSIFGGTDDAKGMLGKIIQLDNLYKRIDKLDKSKLSEEEVKIIELYKDSSAGPQSSS